MRVTSKAITGYFLGYWAIGLAAGICFKEGGTDPGHRLVYFLLGNALGISSTWFLVRLYARMNVNLAMLVACGGGFVIFQAALWLIYHSRLTLVQGAGIVIVLTGMMMALWPSRLARGELSVPKASPAPPEEVTA
jgi:multidrug transporter EmrE-like cation transporter